jgi:gamma-glutamylcyclotransferase (GGCT)/AIG2-like uncharacterized protein YtfP
MYADYLMNCKLIQAEYRLTGYTLYNYRNWYPYMVEKPGSSVVGDIYRVPESILPELHELEGIEEQLFQFVFLSDHNCYTYLKYDGNINGLKYIEGGDWLAYYQSLPSNSRYKDE